VRLTRDRRSSTRSRVTHEITRDATHRDAREVGDTLPVEMQVRERMKKRPARETRRRLPAQPREEHRRERRAAVVGLSGARGPRTGREHKRAEHTYRTQTSRAEIKRKATTAAGRKASARAQGERIEHTDA
jgi:hypothetical protein